MAIGFGDGVTVQGGSMTTDALAVLELLERILSITERFKPEMTREERIEWSKVSAACADLRDGDDV